MMLVASALFLLASTVAAWLVAAASRPAARVQLRFASVLVAAAGVAVLALPFAAPAVALLVLPIATAVLALAARAGFGHAVAPAVSSVLLAVVSLCGIIGAATGVALFALAASVLGTITLLVISLRQVDVARLAAGQGALAALCFGAAQSLFVIERASAPVLLFMAAGILGAALALSRSDRPAKQKAAADLRGAVGGRRTS